MRPGPGNPDPGRALPGLAVLSGSKAERGPRAISGETRGEFFFIFTRISRKIGLFLKKDEKIPEGPRDRFGKGLRPMPRARVSGFFRESHDVLIKSHLLLFCQISYNLS
jgi:hypothetical protein